MIRHGRILKYVLPLQQTNSQQCHLLRDGQKPGPTSILLLKSFHNQPSKTLTTQLNPNQQSQSRIKMKNWQRKRNQLLLCDVFLKDPDFISSKLISKTNIPHWLGPITVSADSRYIGMWRIRGSFGTTGNKRHLIQHITHTAISLAIHMLGLLVHVTAWTGPVPSLL